MTTRTRWLHLLLAALAAITTTLAVLTGATTATATTPPTAENSVRATTPILRTLVGRHETVSPNQQPIHNAPQPRIAVATGVATKAVPASNKIYSARALERMAEEPGPMHNFPGSFDDEIFTHGTRSVSPNYFNHGKPNLSNDSVQYRLPGEINGRSGTFEIFTRPSQSGRTEVIMHRFFRPQ